MGKHTDRDEELHNKGQSDYAKDKYEPPWGIISSSNSKKNAEEQEAYDAGYEHARSQDHSKGCFLTTACVTHAGLSDDCYQLTVLRQFRDRYVMALPKGAEALAEYYAVAPAITRRIDQSPNRDAELKAIFCAVNEAVSLVEQGKLSEALTCYESLFANLKTR
jgi:hypothetical protein